MSRWLPLLSLLVACEPPAPPPPGAYDFGGDVIVTVNGEGIHQGLLDATMRQIPEQLRMQLEQTGQLPQVKERMVLGELLYRQALERKLQDRDEVKENIAVAQRTVLADAMLAEIGAERVTDAAIQGWYTEHLVQYSQPQVFVRHILVATEDEAKQVVDGIRGGADFKQVAATTSKDQGSAAKGGELGWVSAKQIMPELGAAAMALEPGQVSDPVQTRYGWHVLMIDGKRDQVPLEEVREQVEAQVKEEVIQAYLDEVKKGATIVEGSGGATVEPEAPAAPAAEPPPAP